MEADMKKTPKDFAGEEYVRLGALVLKELDKSYLVLIGLDRVFIPIKCATLKETRDGTPVLYVDEGYLDRQLGLRRGTLENKWKGAPPL